MVLSISDAMFTVRFIYGVISQVKDNREELSRLSIRLKHIVTCLAECQDRKLLDPQEYTDALTTVSNLIERTQRLVQRQLKRSLGDRTWRRDEITSEIGRLSQDAQNYLSVHTIKALDIVHAANNRQFTALSGNMEEILVKLAAIDIRLGTPSGPWSSNILAQAKQVGEDVKITRLEGSLVHEDSRMDIVQALAAAGKTILTVKGLLPVNGTETLEYVTIPDLNLNATYPEIQRKIKSMGFVPPDGISEEPLRITVTESVSEYNGMAPGGLQIARSVPLIHWWNKYQENRGKSPASTPGHTLAQVSNSGNSISVGGVRFSFHRTLRVPDTSTVNKLPLNLGRFPILPVSRFERLPDSIRSRGGFIMPMFQREALWISFQMETYQKMSPAVKISVGSVNVISGCAKDIPTPPSVDQDYVVAGLQPWLDGVKTDQEVVKQFVAMPLGKGYTVEEQVTGEAKGGGFQFDIFPRRQPPRAEFIDCRHSDDGREPLEIHMTPEELDLPSGTRIGLSGESLGFHYQQMEKWTLSDYRQRVDSSAALIAKYRRFSTGVSRYPAPSKLHGLPPVDREVESLGIGVGGKIAQKIYQDNVSPRMYDEEHGHRFHVHIISPESWEAVTGMLPPITPITPATYKEHNIPWFSLRDDYIACVESTADSLRKLRSVKELDEAHLLPPPLIDPDQPPRCPRHNQTTAAFIFRPCSHGACAACFGEMVLNRSTCLVCGVSVTRLVGMKSPAPQIVTSNDPGESGEMAWNVLQLEDLALSAAAGASVTVLHLEQDRVPPLHSRIYPPTGAPAGPGQFEY